MAGENKNKGYESEPKESGPGSAASVIIWIAFAVIAALAVIFIVIAFVGGHESSRYPSSGLVQQAEAMQAPDVSALQPFSVAGGAFYAPMEAKAIEHGMVIYKDGDFWHAFVAVTDSVPVMIGQTISTLTGSSDWTYEEAVSNTGFYREKALTYSAGSCTNGVDTFHVVSYVYTAKSGSKVLFMGFTDMLPTESVRDNVLLMSAYFLEGELPDAAEVPGNVPSAGAVTVSSGDAVAAPSSEDSGGAGGTSAAQSGSSVIVSDDSVDSGSGEESHVTDGDIEKFRAEQKDNQVRTYITDLPGEEGGSIITAEYKIGRDKSKVAQHFYIWYSNTLFTPSDVSLTAPDGTVYKADYINEDNDGKIYFVIEQPAVGTWRAEFGSGKFGTYICGVMPEEEYQMGKDLPMNEGGVLVDE